MIYYEICSDTNTNIRRCMQHFDYHKTIIGLYLLLICFNKMCESELSDNAAWPTAFWCMKLQIVANRFLN